MVISTSDTIMKKIIDKRSGLNNCFGIHHSHAGDLVSISYLDNVKRFRESYEFSFTKTR